MNNMIQLFITLLGLPAIILIGRKSISFQKVGYVLGFLSQPFWIWTACLNKQWGILILSCFYSLVWLEGIYRLFISPIIFSDDYLTSERKIMGGE